MRFLKSLFSFLLLICLPALFLWKLTVAGRILVGLDPFNFFYPYHDAVAAALNAGQLPEWNPALFGGVPFLADSQAQLFYPLSWLFLSWRAPDALTWGIVLHLAIAALGTYLWARRGLGMGHAGAWVAGAVFALGGYLGAQVEHVNQVQAASWLPWLLLGYEWGRGMPDRGRGTPDHRRGTPDHRRGMPDHRRGMPDHRHGMPNRDQEPAQNQTVNVLTTQRMFGVVLGAFALAMSLLAGHSQTTYISLVMLGVWTLRSAIRDDERTRTDVLKVQRSGISATIVKAAWRNFIGVNLVPLFIILLIGVLLAAIQLVPTQQLSSLSQRAGGLSYLETVSFSFDPRIIPRALLPTFGQDAHLLSEYVGWVGFIALMLAIIGLLGEYLPWGNLLARPTRASRDFGLLASFTGLFLAFGIYNPVYWLLWRIVPGFSLFRAPARWLLLWALGAAVLAGVGLERLQHARRKPNEADIDIADADTDPTATRREKMRYAPIVVSAGKSGKQAVVVMDEMRATSIVIEKTPVEVPQAPSTVQTSQQTSEKECLKQDDVLFLPEIKEKRKIGVQQPSHVEDNPLRLPENDDDPHTKSNLLDTHPIDELTTIPLSEPLQPATDELATIPLNDQQSSEIDSPPLLEPTCQSSLSKTEHQRNNPSSLVGKETLPLQEELIATPDHESIVTIPLSDLEEIEDERKNDGKVSSSSLLSVSHSQEKSPLDEEGTQLRTQKPLLLPFSDLKKNQTEKEQAQEPLLLPANEKKEERVDQFTKYQPSFGHEDVSVSGQVSSSAYQYSHNQEDRFISEPATAVDSLQETSTTEPQPEATEVSFTSSSGVSRRGTQLTLLMGALLLLLFLLFGAWPQLEILPWWIGALGAAFVVLLSRPIWPKWLPISYPTFVVLLILIELWGGAWSQDYQQATAPEAYNGLRPAPAHLMTAQPEVGAARILSLSNLTWDPGDLNALQERHANLLAEKPIYDLVVVTKLKEVLAPNQPMRWGIQTADGYGGGLLPSARWVSFQKTLPLAKVVPDGRLREQLTERPRPALLDVMGVEWVIVDKVNDWWSENIFHDLGASIRLTAGDTLSGWLIPSPDGTWAVTDISWIVFGDWPATPGKITLDGQTFSLSEAQERATRETWRGTERHMLLTLNKPIRFKEMSIQSDAEWHLGGISLVDNRLPGFQPLPADASVRTAFSGDVTIYQRLDSLGRAWVVPEAVPVETIDAAASFVAEPTFDPRQSVIVEHDSRNPLPTGGEGTVAWLNDEPGNIRLVVNVPEGGWLVLADAPFPGWQAIVDGKPVEWQAANVINRTLYLPAGKHTVTWRYYTPGLLAGLIGTLLGVVALIVWVVYSWRRA